MNQIETTANQTKELLLADAQEYCRQFLAHLNNPDLPRPIAHQLYGRIVRTRTTIESSMLADEAGRSIVFCLPTESLNQLAQEPANNILPSLGYPPEQLQAFRDKGYDFFLVVFPPAEVYPATWESLQKLFCKVYPVLCSTAKRLWSEVASIPFEQFDITITVESFLQLAEQDRTAAQLRGLLFSVWNVNRDFTGTGLTSEGLPELLMKNGAIAEIPDVGWIHLPL